jgi:hypothetical protein
MSSDRSRNVFNFIWNGRTDIPILQFCGVTESGVTSNADKNTAYSSRNSAYYKAQVKTELCLYRAVPCLSDNTDRVPCHHDMVRPQFADEWHTEMRQTVANKSKKSSRTADNRWFGLGLGPAANNPACLMLRAPADMVMRLRLRRNSWLSYKIALSGLKTASAPRSLLVR